MLLALTLPTPMKFAFEVFSFGYPDLIDNDEHKKTAQPKLRGFISIPIQIVSSSTAFVGQQLNESIDIQQINDSVTGEVTLNLEFA